MLTIIIGATGAGKSTLARKLEHLGLWPTTKVISAGEWVREMTGIRTHGPESAKRLADVSQNILRDDPWAAAKWMAARRDKTRTNNAIIEGIRSPRDLLYLVKPGDHVVDVGGEGDCHWERQGLGACRALRPWLSDQGVTWVEYKRHFAALPVPIDVWIEAKHLLGDLEPGLICGRIIALECYEGEPVTALFKGLHGAEGMFHDLPLDLFQTSNAAMDTLSPLPGIDQHCYGPSDVGSPVLEVTPGDQMCRVFSRDREDLGPGRSMYVLHWPQGNTLFHLVAFGSHLTAHCGRLLLWPPHKLLFTMAEGQALPDWKKWRPQR